MAKDVGVAHHDGLATGTRQGHIEFAVDGLSFLNERVGGEEVELVEPADGKRVDDDVALRTLIALHGVDGDGK